MANVVRVTTFHKKMAVEKALHFYIPSWQHSFYAFITIIINKCKQEYSKMQNYMPRAKL